MGVPCWAGSVVAVAEDGGFGAETVRTVRSMASSELRKHGLAVTDAPQLEGVTAVTPEAMQALAGLGADRLFVVRLGRLDEKVPMALEEVDPTSLAPVFVATLTATSIDEADTVLERLVVAVLNREPVERGARLTTVTKQEAEPFHKKPGEGLWMIGLGLEPLGTSLGWSYEAQYWRLGATLQGAEDDVSFFGIEGAWIPKDGQFSPYVGAGLGMVGGEGYGDTVLGAKLEVGVEMFRLHGVRLLAGVNAIVPLESRPGADSFNPGVHLRLGF
jgi:hypothetical protein